MRHRSAFVGRGKLGALKLVRSEHCRDLFSDIGQSWEPSVDHSRANCILHPREQWTPTQPATSLSAHGVESSSVYIASTMRGLPLHAYNGISGDAVSNQSASPKPIKRDWVRNDDGQLTVDWMRGSPAPEPVPQMVSCKRHRICKLPDVSA